LFFEQLPLPRSIAPVAFRRHELGFGFTPHVNRRLASAAPVALIPRPYGEQL
jgi:hypothetical protein